MMDPTRLEEKTKLRLEKSKEAIALVLDGKWERAVVVNQEILWLFPEDVEALNRLGKAFLQLGRYSAARSAFESAAKIAPHNTISKKNLERLTHLQDTASPPKESKVVTPYLFIEESGKSGITVLHKPAPRQVLAKMAAGDPVRLECRGDHMLVVENNHDEYLGQVELKLGIRLMRLIKGGNRYDAAIISIDRQEISIIISETYRHPGPGSVYSFPTKSKEEYKVYWRDASLRYDIDSELEEDEEPVSDWKESYPDGSEASDGDEPAESLYTGKSEQANPDDDEEE